MKAIIATSLLIASSLVALAQDKEEGPVLTPMLLFERDGGGKRVFLEAATDKAIRYRVNEYAAAFVDARIGEFKSIYVFEPTLLSEAKDLYQGRKYQEALDKIKEVQKVHAPIAALLNGPVAEANFLELECLRKLGDLKGLDKALRLFDKGSVTREIQQRQLQIYLFWDKVRNEEWNKLSQLAETYDKIKLTGEQRAQVAYCYGLALEKIERPKEALLQYHIVLTADAGASEVIARDAAIRILEILQNDPDVKEAKAAWDAEGEAQPMVGTIGLHEAAAVAEMFEITLGAGASLPGKYEYFLKYRIEAPEAAAPKKKEEGADKGDADKAPDAKGKKGEKKGKKDK